MKLPLATYADLVEEEAWVLAALESMDSAVVVDHERFENRRLSLVDHLRDVRLQLAEKAAA